MTALLIILASAVLLMAMLLWTVWPLIYRVTCEQLHALTEAEARDACRPLSNAVELVDDDEDEPDDERELEAIA